MGARQDLNRYLDALQWRLRLRALSRGGALLATVALTATVMLVLLIRALLFSALSVSAARLALCCVLAVTIGVGIAVPLWRLTRRRASATAEQHFPQFQQRLVTFADRDSSDPFVELLAADTLELARGAEPAALASNARLLGWLGLGVGCAALLVWLIAAAPGFLGYGSHLLWTATARGAAPRFDIQVAPGDVTIRRHSDQLITARPEGIGARELLLYAHYQSSAKWERVAMQLRPDAPGYQFTITGVPENVEYYVAAGARHSRHYSIRVVDPPQVKQIRVTYHFPEWTGLPQRVEEQGGDLRALEGSRADLQVVTDRPLQHGMLVLDSGQQIALSGGENNVYRGALELQQDGAYHVAALDQGQAIRVSEDFFIEARKPSPPMVSIARPGGDYRASPIEEVTVKVHGADEFGLTKLELHYTVNGGAEHTVGLLRRPALKQADGSSVLALEDFKLQPGDVIGLYATAKDARLESHTDIAFIQVEPFSREFSQSQAMGGGGGGGGGGSESSEISQREKEIIAATFRQLNDKSGNGKQAAETAKFLSEVQTALRNQSLALAGRLQLRELTGENSEFSRFQQEMSAAAAAMQPPSQQLERQKWQDAVVGEQQALQHLLRAEATFRQIEIAYGAGGGGGGGAGRDLASLFDLELDTEKNQYETKQTASAADQRAQDINDALKKLDELARRQEQLAQRPPGSSTDEAEQRWQQEMLEREAQRLQQQIEQLAQSGQQGGARQGGQQSSQQGGQQSGQQGGQQSTQQSAEQGAQQAQQRLREAQEQLRQAREDMQRAGANGRSAADQRLAAQRLREASNALGGLQSRQDAQRLGAIANETRRLSAAQSEQRERLQRLQQRGQGGRASDRDTEQLIKDRQRMADDLASLAQNMRNAARELDAGQRAAADKLRDALKDMDDADLEPLVQRTTDRLRAGSIGGGSRDVESEIAAALQHLDQQAHDAQRALNAGGQQPGDEGTEEALNRVARLREQVDALSRVGSQQSPNGQPGDDQQPGSQLGGNQPGGNQPAGNQPGGGQAGGGQSGGSAAGGNLAGDSQPGGGGGTRAFVDNNIDTGGNARPGVQAHAPAQVASLRDGQQLIRQGLGELQGLRQQAGTDAEVQRQIQQLIAEMQHLDLRRFPGNPQMVEHIHQQLLSDIDTLELQLRQGLDAQPSDRIRSADPLAVPRGYEDAVADYFRRLSTVNTANDRTD
jgi:hypothetical protein